MTISSRVKQSKLWKKMPYQQHLFLYFLNSSQPSKMAGKLHKKILVWSLMHCVCETKYGRINQSDPLHICYKEPHVGAYMEPESWCKIVKDHKSNYKILSQKLKYSWNRLHSQWAWLIYILKEASSFKKYFD